MKKRMSFCEECRKDVEAIVSNIQIESLVNGKKYKYDGRIACCPICSAEVYVEDICDSNLMALHKKYNEKIPSINNHNGEMYG